MNELLPGRLIASLTPRRISNLVKASASFLISSAVKRPVVWGVPPVLTIEPTNICNLRCPLCTTGSGAMKRESGLMTLETFSTILEKFGQDIFFLLIYHQGEPYLNKRFFDFVRLAKDHRIYVTTSTNGHYFTAGNIEQTIASGLDSMIVSIDGVNQSSYETYRVRGSLDKVIEGTGSLMEARKAAGSRTPNVALQFLVMKHNEHEIPEMRRLARDLGVDKLLIKNIEVHNKTEADRWLPESEKFRRYHYDGERLTVKRAEKRSCPRPWVSSLVNWDGTVVPCCFDKNGDHPLGHIQNGDSLKMLWNNEAYGEFRSRLTRDRSSIDICRNCNQGFGSFIPLKFRRSRKDQNDQVR